nr:hypothetical protein [Tanacetum cinerariifolium]
HGKKHSIIEQEIVADKEPIVNAATIVTIDDITLAKELEALKTLKPKIRGIVMKDHKEPSESRTTTTTIISSKKSQDKGKAKMIEETMKLKKKYQILFDEEVARKLQEEINEEERLAKVDVDYQLAKRMQAEEQQELNEEENAKLFMELLDKRRKFFATKRTEEKRNRPPTKAQQRSLITELVEESSKKVEAKITQEESLKRAVDELEQEIAKKQNIIDNKETTNLKQLVKIIPEEDIEIDAIPLAVKTLIIDWKIYKEGKKSYYQIIRAGGKLKNYLVFNYVLKVFDREDVETLWKLVKAKYGSTKKEEDYDRVLWGDLKAMFDLHLEIATNIQCFPMDTI